MPKKAVCAGSIETAYSLKAKVEEMQYELTPAGDVMINLPLAWLPEGAAATAEGDKIFNIVTFSPEEALNLLTFLQMYEETILRAAGFETPSF